MIRLPFGGAAILVGLLVSVVPAAVLAQTEVAEFDVTIAVTGGTVTIDHPTVNAQAGDTITFHSNETVYVVFETGEWPFTGSPPSGLTITVSSSAGPFQVKNAPGAIDDYDVTLGGAAQATGHVDIEDD